MLAQDGKTAHSVARAFGRRDVLSALKQAQERVACAHLHWYVIILVLLLYQAMQLHEAARSCAEAEAKEIIKRQPSSVHYKDKVSHCYLKSYT